MLRPHLCKACGGSELGKLGQGLNKGISLQLFGFIWPYKREGKRERGRVGGRKGGRGRGEGGREGEVGRGRREEERERCGVGECIACVCDAYSYSCLPPSPVLSPDYL